MKFVELVTKLVDIKIHAYIKLKEGCKHCGHEEELVKDWILVENKIIEDFQPYMQRKVIAIKTEIGTYMGDDVSYLVIVLSEEDIK